MLGVAEVVGTVEVGVVVGVVVGAVVPGAGVVVPGAGAVVLGAGAVVPGAGEVRRDTEVVTAYHDLSMPSPLAPPGPVSPT